jgi:sulfite exporter TauE/SafE
MLKFLLGCVVGLLAGMFLYAALLVAAESGRDDAED